MASAGVELGQVNIVTTSRDQVRSTQVDAAQVIAGQNNVTLTVHRQADPAVVAVAAEVLRPNMGSLCVELDQERIQPSKRTG